MPINLKNALRLSTASADEKAMLADLQMNILDGHGRQATRNVFINFLDAEKGRAFVRAIAAHVTSAQRQLNDADEHRRTGKSGGPVVGLMLSSAGYAFLGRGDIMPTPDDGGAFAEGMLARGGLLNDPPAAQLEAGYRDRIHAMILIGADPDGPDKWTSAQVEAKEDEVLGLADPSAFDPIVMEVGRAIFRRNVCGSTDGIEHFGYVDGRSQPLMIEELADRESEENGGIAAWDPRFPLGQVLVPDPGAANAVTGFGSFFVFRKLEQDVKGFKKAEDDLGLGELGGALLVGRFEDGSPVTLFAEESKAHPVPNNFNYRADMDGLRCPFSAHIRKTNPRGDTARLFGNPPADPQSVLAGERSHIMARRGMPFGTRDHVVDPQSKPSGGVGLMFMAFQANLRDQFEFTQASWANEPRFAPGFAGQPDPGRDPIIGQRGSNPPVPIKMRDKWDDPKAHEHPVSFAEHVRHRGGEYFFAPAISTLTAF